MKSKLWGSICVLIGSLMLGACGGGGTTAGPSTSAVSFTGNTAQATVTSANARALSVNAYQGGMSGTQLSVTGVSSPGGTASAQSSASHSLSLATILLNAAKDTLASSAQSSANIAGVTTQQTIAGPYGGTAQYSISVNQATGAFSGTMLFSGYSGEKDSHVSGTVNFSGAYNFSTQTFASISISFAAISITENGITHTAAGSLSESWSGTTASIAMSLVLKDGQSGKTYWVKDFTITYTQDSPPALTISGTYYDHDYGYVVISTVTPLQVSTMGGTPTAGVLLFSGKNGSKARLTFNSSGYTVEADIDGSNNYVTVP
jgi:hypothetical protein